MEGRECSRSNVQLASETDDAWVFICRTCDGINVISKDGVRNRSQFELAKKRYQENVDLQRRWEKRKKIFAVR